ncbi:MAG: efflux transporter periplasmic adaptor subunit [Burkholderiales bacterium PBB4]|nr:MAG: efflux transporter periplasmic adaptor subunit [Burkholderiales bacterium PBB4]
MLRPLLLVLALTASLAACNKPSDKGAKKEGDAAPVKLVIAPEDMLTVSGSAVTSGPVITGSIQPERKADLRAEVSAVVLQVLKENGDVVRRGDVLVRLDETAIRDNLNSAQDAARNATLALDQAQRNVERLKTLRASGMTSLQALDEAEVRRNAAQSELSAANARTAQASQQLQRTLIRAPFDGVVSDRKVSAGDTASVGKELLKVLDPTSLRFEGRVSSDRISDVKVGQAVGFSINGYAGQEFRGKVTRLDPSANAVTRQVEVLVSFTDKKQPQVSGLYAEGIVESSQVTALTLPEAVLMRAGDKVTVWRIKGNKLDLVELAVGARDPRTGNYEVKTGLAGGDMIVRRPGSSFKAGQDVELVANKPAAPAAAAVPAAPASAPAAV